MSKGKLAGFIEKNGVGNTVARAMKYASPGYRRYQVYRDKRYRKYIKKAGPDEMELKEQRERKFGYSPKFSILVPLYETEEAFLDELIYYVRLQTYSNWELCLSDGSRDKARLEKILRPYIENDSRIKLVNSLEGPLGISENTNQAYDIMTGDFLVLGDHDDLMTPDALFECVKALNNDRTIDVIYTDEDKTDTEAKVRFEPTIKSDFNIDEIGSCNYITHMFVAKKSLVEKVGALRPEFDGAQDYDFILRCVEAAENIYHIPKVLYSWRVNETSTAGNAQNKTYAYEAGAKALQEHYDRLGLPVEVEQSEYPGFYNPIYDISDMPLVSVMVIPNSDEDIMRCCIESFDDSRYNNLEFILPEWYEELDDDYIEADFDAESEADEENESLLNLASEADDSYEEEINLIRYINRNINRANGEYILIVDSRAYLHSEEAISDMLGILHVRKDVGAVGPKIFDGNGYYRHAGVVFRKNAMAHGEFLRQEKNDDTLVKYKDYTFIRSYVFMTRKSLLKEMGGLSHEYQNLSYSVMDYCLSLKMKGYLSVYNGTNLFGYATKDENKRRTEEDKESLKRDMKVVTKKWKGLLRDGDFYYPLSKHDR